MLDELISDSAGRASLPAACWFLGEVGVARSQGPEL